VARKIHSYTEIPSSNRTAFELAAAGAAHGEIVLAKSQTAGRGRLGKVWKSPEGQGLYLSIIVRPDLPKEDYPKLTIATGLAIASVLDEMCKVSTLLKWPNDIMLSGRKCGGILCEACLDGDIQDSHFAIIGIGLNVLTRHDQFPEKIQDSATSLYLETGKQFDFQSLVTRITDQVLLEIQRLENQGFSSILKEWKRRDYLYGKWLKWLTHGDEVVFAKAEGPDHEGRLKVRDEAGKLHMVISGDISLAGKWQKKGASRDNHDSSLDCA
jgi:BirA family biotin operon repressor/biotin-[acetyl-CoA-carboxylase] ligase